MTGTKKDPVLVVLQLTGGNDPLNCVIPYADPLYREFRPAIGIPDDQILHLDDKVGLHPRMVHIRDMYNEGKVAIIHGIGFANSPRSHFRAMDIWHTCEPEKSGTEGWLGRATRDLDPNAENVVTAVSFGQTLHRALVVQGVPVATVDDLENYGMLTGFSEEQERAKALESFARLYSPAIGRGPVMDYLGQTGRDSLKGEDILKVAPQMYSSSVEYPDTPIGRSLKGIAQIHLANLGSRILYCEHGNFDSHAGQVALQDILWKAGAEAIECFFDDLKKHDAADNVIMLIFTEFGRRVRDNNSGTDHGAGGVSFVLGDPVKGGQYGEYPSMKLEDQSEGDLAPNLDFRGMYSTIVEDWLGLDARPIVGGAFEKPKFFG